MTLKKDMICMCEHKRSEHDKDIFRQTRECGICQCSQFMRNNRPRFIDKLAVVLGIVMVLLYAAAPIIVYVDVLSDMSDEELNKTIQVPFHLYYTGLLITVLLFSIIMGILFYRTLIKDYFIMARRKKHSKKGSNTHG